LMGSKAEIEKAVFMFCSTYRNRIREKSEALKVLYCTLLTTQIPLWKGGNQVYINMLSAFCLLFQDLEVQKYLKR
jgi:hypothetical protein